MNNFEVYETPFETTLCISDTTSFLFPSGYNLDEYEKMIKVLTKTRFTIKRNQDDYLVYREDKTTKVLYLRKDGKTITNKDIYDHLLFIYKEIFIEKKKELDLL